MDTKQELIRRDLRQLRHTLFDDNEINNWRKIIIVYNLYLLYLHMYGAYYLINGNINNNNSNNKDIKNTFLFFFLLCNIRTSYMYMIMNVNKVDRPLAFNLHSNFKEYFMF
jgi:hypothetical protein